MIATNKTATNEVSFLEKRADMVTEDNVTTIPVIEESLTVGKRIIETGGVRLIKTITEHQETIDQTLSQESVAVDRVVVNRLLEKDEPLPTPRTEGDIYIVPLFEEVLIVERRVRLIEELRVTRSRTETNSPQTVTVRRENVRVEPIAVINDLQESQDKTHGE